MTGKCEISDSGQDLPGSKTHAISSMEHFPITLKPPTSSLMKSLLFIYYSFIHSNTGLHS